MAKKLPKHFYDRPAQLVAPELLGKHLVFRKGSRVLRARVVETEAYCGVEDKACHAHKGRTKRTEVMFGPPAVSYVYLVYGMHHMFNIVTHGEGEAHAVLLRALELDDNLDLRGPGKLTKFFGISMKHNGLDLCGSTLYFEEGPSPKRIRKSARIGIHYAGNWINRKLRFFDADSRHLSR